MSGTGAPVYSDDGDEHAAAGTSADTPAAKPAANPTAKKVLKARKRAENARRLAGDHSRSAAREDADTLSLAETDIEAEAGAEPANPAAVAAHADTTTTEDSESESESESDNLIADDSITDDTITDDTITDDTITDDTDSATDGTDEPATPVDPNPGARRPARGRVPLAATALVLALCVAFAVVALVRYLNAGSSGSTNSSGTAATRLRDTVLLDAQQDITVLNTMDYTKVDEGLRNWADASTGNLHASLLNGTDAAKAQIVAAKKVTTAVVKSAALTTLDPADGTASVIASVYVYVQPQTGKAVLHTERLRGDLTRVGTQWKLSLLAPVEVTSS